MVAVCSALVVSVAGLVTSVSGTADRVAAQVAGTADLEVAPAFSGGTVPDDVVDDVAALPGVAAAASTVQSAVTVDATRALLVAGDARALPFLPPGLADAYAETAGTPPAEAGGEDTGAGPAVLVSVALADDTGLAAGDTVAVRGLTGVTDARVAGVLPEEVAGATVVADLTTGERLRGGGDGPDRLLLALDGDAAGTGGGERAVARRVDEVLAGRAVALDPARRGDAAAETLQPLLRPLLLLSGLTVTVAAVLVFNVVSLAVAERRRYLAIQCALGARRRRAPAHGRTHRPGAARPRLGGGADDHRHRRPLVGPPRRRRRGRGGRRHGRRCGRAPGRPPVPAGGDGAARRGGRAGRSGPAPRRGGRGRRGDRRRRDRGGGAGDAPAAGGARHPERRRRPGVGAAGPDRPGGGGRRPPARPGTPPPFSVRCCRSPPSSR